MLNLGAVEGPPVSRENSAAQLLPSHPRDSSLFSGVHAPSVCVCRAVRAPSLRSLGSQVHVPVAALSPVGQYIQVHRQKGEDTGSFTSLVFFRLAFLE